MFTDSRHHRRSAAPEPVGVFARVAERMQRFVCGLHGHDALLHFERGHMSLLCTSCGYAYPVRDDIPVLLVDEARRPDGGDG